MTCVYRGRLLIPGFPVVDLIASSAGGQSCWIVGEELVPAAKFGSATACDIFVWTSRLHHLISRRSDVFVDIVKPIQTGASLLRIHIIGLFVSQRTSLV